MFTIRFAIRSFSSTTAQFFATTWPRSRAGMTGPHSLHSVNISTKPPSLTEIHSTANSYSNEPTASMSNHTPEYYYHHKAHGPDEFNNGSLCGGRTRPCCQVPRVAFAQRRSNGRAPTLLPNLLADARWEDSPPQPAAALNLGT